MGRAKGNEQPLLFIHSRRTVAQENPFFVLVSDFVTEIAFISFFHQRC